MNEPVVEIGAKTVLLRLPTGDFIDTVIAGLQVGPSGSTVGRAQVVPWTRGRIAEHHKNVRRFLRLGRPVAAVIVRARRPVAGDGLVQRGARRLRVPLERPAPSSLMVRDGVIDRRGYSHG